MCTSGFKLSLVVGVLWYHHGHGHERLLFFLCKNKKKRKKKIDSLLVSFVHLFLYQPISVVFEFFLFRLLARSFVFFPLSHSHSLSLSLSRSLNCCSALTTILQVKLLLKSS